ncbi:HD domain-containing phosphohydrolase [Alkaliphilus peptidifermentans]|nr:transporter substrate-binding domain-containing protein [Alkaliphilus peptidifermentans]
MKKLIKLIILLPLIFPLMLIQIGETHGNEKDENRYKIVIGDDINYPPYSYIDSNGNPTGFNIELARAVGRAMGYDVEIRLDEWSNIREALETGEIDAISGMFYSKEREMSYSFSTKHTITNGDIFTQNNMEISSIEDLYGKQVVVQRSDIVSEYLQGLDLNIELIEVPTVYEALKLIEDEVYQYAGLLKLPGLYSIRENNFKNLKAQDLELAPQDYSMAVKKGNEDLLMLLNGGLHVLKATGEYEEIYDAWLSIYEPKTLTATMRRYRGLLAIVGLTFITLIIMNLMLKHIVDRRTKELQNANQILFKNQEELRIVNGEMEAAIEEAIAMEEELRKQYNYLMESEHKLKTSESKNRAIIDALPDIVFTISEDGIFLDRQANENNDMLLSREKIVDKKLEDIFPLDIAYLGYQKIKSALQTGELQSFEFQLEERKDEFYEIRIVKSRENQVIGITRNITTDRLYKREIEYLSYHDHLTGLYNRRFFDERLKKLDTESNYPLCIIMADVNGLKLVNDSFGHLMGDNLLKKFSEILKNICIKDEVICRIGGDEFVILIPRMDKVEAEDLINRIKHRCEGEKIGSVELSISFGWDIKRHAEEDIHEVFNKAENYMYKRKLFEGPSMRGKTIKTILNTLHEKNQRENEHSRRVSELCTEFAKALSLSEREVEELRTVGLLHDIGKISINEDILNKPGKLTKEEFDEIKRHPEIGYRILSTVNDMADMADFVLCHHERWDGKGYPRGLKENEIPVQARMIAIVDAYDAMISNRSYRAGMTYAEAVEELVRNSGTQFDPHLVIIFVEKVINKEV